MSQNIIADFSNFPKAGEFLNAILSQKYNIIIYGGAIRGGKTFTSLVGLTLLHRLYPRSRSCVTRDTLKTLRTNTKPSCDKVFPKNFIKDYNRSNYEWTFTNDSVSFFFAENIEGDRELDRWKGLEVNWILLEQIEEMQFDTFKKAIERAGAYVIPELPIDKQPTPMVIATVNPTMNWVKKEIYNRHIEGTLPDNWLYIDAKITDNPHIPEGFKQSLKELKRIDPVKYDRFVNGNWDIMDKPPGAFWKNFDVEKHVKPVTIDTKEVMHISFDENVNPYPALTCWQMEGPMKIKQVKEFALRSPNNKLITVAREFCKWLKSIEFNNVVYIYGDSTSRKEDAKLEQGYNYFSMLRKEIENNGFRAIVKDTGGNPPVALSGEFINAIYEYNFSDLEIIIGDNNEESILDYMSVTETVDGHIDKKKVRGIELYGHITDTKRYFICEIWKSHFKKYQNAGQIYTGLLETREEQTY